MDALLIQLIGTSPNNGLTLHTRHYNDFTRQYPILHSVPIDDRPIFQLGLIPMT